MTLTYFTRYSGFYIYCYKEDGYTYWYSFITKKWNLSQYERHDTEITLESPYLILALYGDPCA